jgi:triacylglycerol esterase/lipase EstA (alpha/beta hydrolase family)
MRRFTVTAAFVSATSLLAAGAAPGLAASRAGVHAASDCRPSAAAADQPTNGNSPPPAAPRYFATDFPRVVDRRLKFATGGLGGLRRNGPRKHVPVVFVHGNQADAQNWLSVMLQFQRLAGYSMQEMYAVSYNGLGNFYAGAPSAAPTQPDQDYFTQNPDGFGNGGHGAADEDEVPDLCRFVQAVQSYTGTPYVDIVAHSLGVTIVRKMMADYPQLARHVRAFVAIAGANHGTSVCRGLESSYYGCNEIAPGSPWLAKLNAHDETPGATAYMTVYNGSAGDPFFNPPLDEQSPALRGARNATYPGAYHNDLRVDPGEVDDYLAFLLVHGQLGRPSPSDRALAQRLSVAHPDGRTGTLCGVPKLTGC